MAEHDRLSALEVKAGQFEVLLSELRGRVERETNTLTAKVQSLEKLKLWGGIAAGVLVVFGVGGSVGAAVIQKATSRIATLNGQLDSARTRLDSTESRLAQLPDIRRSLDAALGLTLKSFDSVAVKRTQEIIGRVRLADSWLGTWETRRPLLKKKSGDNELLDSATAKTDGFLVVDISAGDELVTIVRGYTAASGGQWSLRMNAAAMKTMPITGREQESFVDNKSFTMPVSRGQRWKIDLNGEVSQVRVHWVALEPRLVH
jgi:hypothetical protein